MIVMMGNLILNHSTPLMAPPWREGKVKKAERTEGCSQSFSGAVTFTIKLLTFDSSDSDFWKEGYVVFECTLCHDLKLVVLWLVLCRVTSASLQVSFLSRVSEVDVTICVHTCPISLAFSECLHLSHITLCECVPAYIQHFHLSFVHSSYSVLPSLVCQVDFASV